MDQRTVSVGCTRGPFAPFRDEQAPDLVEVKVAHQAIPQYLVGHLDRVKKMEQELSQQFPRLKSCSSFDGVSVNDCIASSKSYSG